MFHIGKKYRVAHKNPIMGVAEGRVSDSGESVLIEVKEGDFLRWHRKDIKYFHLLDEVQEDLPPLEEIMKNRGEQQRLADLAEAAWKEKHFECVKAKIFHHICTLKLGGYALVKTEDKTRVKEILDHFNHPLVLIEYLDTCEGFRVSMNNTTN